MPEVSEITGPVSPRSLSWRRQLWVLTARNLRASLALSAAAMGLLFAFFALGAYLYSTFGETNRDAMSSISPEFLIAFFGGMLGGFQPVDLWLITLWAHPLLVVVTVAVLVSPALRDLCGEVDRGTVDLTLGCPLPRWVLVLSVWLTQQVLLLTLSGVLWAALYAGGAALGSGSADGAAVLAALPKYGGVLLQHWLLAQTIAGLALWFGASQSLYGRAMAKTLGLVIFSYFLNLLAGLWSLIAPLRWFSIFNYYQPQPILAGQAQGLERVVLAALALGLLSAALWVFETRDIQGP